MYCSRCGNQMSPDARFCSSCGIPVASVGEAGRAGVGSSSSQGDRSVFSSETTTTDAGSTAWSSNPGVSATSPRMASGIVRPRTPRLIAGVCSGIALQYGWDLTLVRIVTVVVSLVWGVGVLVYLAAWIIIPEDSYRLPRSI